MRKIRCVIMRGGTSKAVVLHEQDLPSDPDERAEAIDKMGRLGAERLSENFLAAHGLNPDDGWPAFKPDNPLVIMKLGDVSDIVGLKYP